MLGLGKSSDVLGTRVGRRRRNGAAARGATGMSFVVGTALTLTGWLLAERPAERMAGFGPSVGCLALAVSLLVRAMEMRGRVRSRLLLLAGSAAAGCVYRAVVNVLSDERPAWGPQTRQLLGSVVVTEVAAVGLGVAGLVVAADAGAGRHTWLRRVLDGAVTAGAVFMAGWVLLLREVGGGCRPRAAMVGVLWTGEVLFLGFLSALCRVVRPEQRATVYVAAVGLSITLVGDTLRLWTAVPHSPGMIPSGLADACAASGLLVVAAAPWAPGGASVLGAGRTMTRSGAEGAAAFVPLTVCTVMTLGYVLAPLDNDPILLILGVTVLLGFWARQTFLPSEKSGLDHDP